MWGRTCGLLERTADNLGRGLKPSCPTFGGVTKRGLVHWPILACCSVAALAGLAFLTLPGGSVLRVSLSAAILFFVPGYLLLEAAAGPAANLRSSLLRSALAIGISPAIVGLLALATALAPQGFRPAAIVVAVTLGCFALAGVATWRRFAQHRLPPQVHVTPS